MQVLSLGREDLLEEDMATHSSILAWRILWTEEPGGLQFMGSQESDMIEATEHSHTHPKDKTMVCKGHSNLGRPGVLRFMESQRVRQD